RADARRATAREDSPAGGPGEPARPDAPRSRRPQAVFAIEGAHRRDREQLRAALRRVSALSRRAGGQDPSHPPECLSAPARAPGARPDRSPGRLADGPSEGDRRPGGQGEGPEDDRRSSRPLRAGPRVQATFARGLESLAGPEGVADGGTGIDRDGPAHPRAGVRGVARAGRRSRSAGRSRAGGRDDGINGARVRAAGARGRDRRARSVPRQDGIMSQTDFVSKLPAWARGMAGDVTAKTATLYILYGAPQDLVRSSSGAFVPLENFLADDLFGTRKSVISFNRAEGFGFGNAEARSHFYTTLTGEDARLEALPRDPLRALALLDRYLRRSLLETPPRSILIQFPFAETLVPGGDALSLSLEDRASIIWLRRWSQDPVLRAADVTIVLETENLSDLDAKLVRSPNTRSIEIPRADAKDRSEFLSTLRPAEWFGKRSELPLAGFVSATAGMIRLQLQQLADAADARDGKITAADLSAEKRRILEAECYGLLEFVQSPFTLADVAGHEGVKKRLRAASQ